MVERAELRGRADGLEAELRRQGATLVAEDAERGLYRPGPPVAPPEGAG